MELWGSKFEPELAMGGLGHGPGHMLEDYTLNKLSSQSAEGGQYTSQSCTLVEGGVQGAGISHSSDYTHTATPLVVQFI